MASLVRGVPPTLLESLPSTCQVTPPATKLHVQDRRCLMSPAPGKDVRPRCPRRVSRSRGGRWCAQPRPAQGPGQTPAAGSPSLRRPGLAGTATRPGGPSACGLHPWREAWRGTAGQTPQHCQPVCSQPGASFRRQGLFERGWRWGGSGHPVFPGLGGGSGGGRLGFKGTDPTAPTAQAPGVGRGWWSQGGEP